MKMVSHIAFPLIQADYTGLSAYYSTGASLGSKLHAEFLKQGVLKDIIAARKAGPRPPWKRETFKPADELANRVLSSKFLIDPKDRLFKRDNLSEDIKKLFAMYKALDRMKELTEYAQTTKGRGMSGILDAIFQSQISTVSNYVSDSAFQKFNLVSGLIKDKIESTVKIPQIENAPRYVGTIVSSSRTTAIAGVASGDKFTITVTLSGVDNVVNIDLADVSGTLSLDNITDYVNTQLLSAGISTTFNVERTSETQYGIRIEIGYGETVNFSADAATEAKAIYITGTRGTGDSGGAFVTKLDDIATADPTEGFYKGIDSLEAVDKAAATAVDSEGNIYVVGSTAGDLGDLSTEGTSDVYLNKYDSVGNLLFTQRLGAKGDASGFAIAIDSDDNVIIAGQVSGILTTDGYGGGYDTFVTQYDKKGQELWTRQAATSANDAGLTLTIDSSNNIFVAGLAYGAIASDQTYGGGSDAYVTKLDSSGTLVYNKQFAEAGDEKVTAITVDTAGNIYVAGENDGSLFVRKYADSAASTADWEYTGSLGTDGAITGIALDSSNNVYFTGYTSDASLFGSPVAAHSGDVDAFMAKLDNAAGTLTFGTYFGTTSADKAYAIAIDTATDDAYITGSTAGTLSGETSSSKVDGFAAKFDSTGALVWNHQFGGAFDQAGLGIAFDTNGTSVLSRLGLSSGQVPQEYADSITSSTTVRDGQYFYISVNGGAATKITIDRDDSFGILSFKLRAALGVMGTAEFVDDDIRGRFLTIEALHGNKIEITAGRDGYNALAGLGLSETILFGKPGDDDDEASASANPYELGFANGMNVMTESKASEALVLIENAQREIKKIYKFLIEGPEKDFVDPGQASLLTLQRLAAYKAAFDQVQTLNFTSGSTALALLTLA
ncbi:MAG: SBBP repeat-containing protein [Proteobacteria bacterium]|nr:SBBP repeat-containing protein [Pseudomonadota bacterium]